MAVADDNVNAPGMIMMMNGEEDDTTIDEPTVDPMPAPIEEPIVEPVSAPPPRLDLIGHLQHSDQVEVVQHDSTWFGLRGAILGRYNPINMTYMVNLYQVGQRRVPATHLAKLDDRWTPIVPTEVKIINQGPSTFAEHERIETVEGQVGFTVSGLMISPSIDEDDSTTISCPSEAEGFYYCALTNTRSLLPLLWI